ncbi:MAG: hypothetical protein NTV80_11775, partial [Verrucomicrobia bacterium]|nr:hypothetical protein [Verrucomicrobiota bacterium]
VDVDPSWREFEAQTLNLDLKRRKFSVPSAHVDLAGDGSGDQRGAAFLKQVDGSLSFGGECIELGGLAI